MHSFDVQRPTGRCAVTDRELNEGEPFYAVLFEQGEGFRRVDCSLDAWTQPPDGAFCYFKTKVPKRVAKKRLLLDDNLLVEFFERLADESNESKAAFRFVLALLLMRKRLLHYDTTIHKGDDEYWRMLMGKEKAEHLVLNPQLSDEQIQEVSEQIGLILHGDMGDFSQKTMQETQPDGSEGKKHDEHPTPDDEASTHAPSTNAQE